MFVNTHLLLKSPKGGSFQRQRKSSSLVLGFFININPLLMKQLRPRRRRESRTRRSRTPRTMRQRTLRRRKPSKLSKLRALRELRKKERREKVRASVLAPNAS
jgi:hypothetical protein